jgi:hypothetical protein
MALRFYVLPKVAVTEPIPSAEPKYLTALGVSPFASVDYGLENTYLTGAEVTPEQHAALAAELDVIAIPANLDANIGLSALSTVKQKLEGLLVPSEWVTTSHTYRDVLRLTARLFQFMQRFHGHTATTLFQAGIDLDALVGGISQAHFDAVANAAAYFGVSLAGINNQSTVRFALRTIALRMAAITIMGESF